MQKVYLGDKISYKFPIWKKPEIFKISSTFVQQNKLFFCLVELEWTQKIHHENTSITHEFLKVTEHVQMSIPFGNVRNINLIKTFMFATKLKKLSLPKTIPNKYWRVSPRLSRLTQNSTDP